jgi:hypothetical protein
MKIEELFTLRLRKLFFITRGPMIQRSARCIKPLSFLQQGNVVLLCRILSKNWLLKWETRFSPARSPPTYNGALAATNEVCARQSLYVGLYSASPIYQTRVGVKIGCLMLRASPATGEKNFSAGYCILYWSGSYLI